MMKSSIHKNNPEYKILSGQRSKKTSLVVAFIAALCCCGAACGAEAARPPNVVLILADDLGYTDLGCYGSRYYETPRIDRMAAEGLRLTSGYTCGPNCQPTRAAFMSGQYGPRTGVYTVGSIDRFDWPNPQVQDRFEANCLRHGVPPGQRITWKADTHTMRPEQLMAKLGGVAPRFMHVDSEHSRAGLAKELELATAVLAPAGVMVLDDMLHPGYPLLVVAVHDYLERHRDMRVVCIIDRETVVAAAKLVLCRADWAKRYEERLLEAYKDNVWPMGADFDPNWCPVFSLDTRLAEIPT